MEKLLKIFKFSNFQISKGRGVYLFDNNNKKYLDFSSGIAVNALGYDHPLIKKLIKKQINTGILHLSGSQMHKYKSSLSSKLSSLTNKGMVFFSNSGAESIEAALKFAKIWGSKKNKNEIISMQGSFHGRTLGALSISSNKYYKTKVGKIPSQVKFCKFNDINDLKKIINPKKTLAIILECIQGDGGIYVCSKKFSTNIKKICKKYNILLIIDEIQTGIGRTGKLFSYQYYSFKPDIITVAKALGGGYPIAATIVSKKIANSIEIGKHGSTFGGGMMQTRLANAVLDYINNKKFLKEINNKGEYLKRQLNNLKMEFPTLIKDVRGRGLMLAIEFKNHYNMSQFFSKCIKNGLIITIINKYSVRFTPPLIIKKNEIDLGISKLRKVLSSKN